MESELYNIHRKEIIDRRIGKLDSLFLWISSFSGLGFSIFVVYFKTSPGQYMPVFLLIGYSIVFGYIRGTVFSDSFTERIRGWNYLILGLCIYVPSAIIRFGELHVQTLVPYFPRLVPYFQLSFGIAVPFIYVFLAMRYALPRIYKSFEISYGHVTSKILGRTFLASLCLGCLLYMFGVALYQMKTDFLSLLLYVLFGIVFIAPLISEETIIQTFLKLEKYQRFVGVESVVNEKLRKASLASIVFGIIAFVIQWEFSACLTLSLWILLFFLAFCLPIFGLIFLLFFVYEADRVMINENADKELSENQLNELTKLVSVMNNRINDKSTQPTIREVKKENGKFAGKHFFALAFLAGLAVTFVIGGGLFVSYQYAPSYSFQPNYQGFAVARNYTQNIMPYFLRVRISTPTEQPVLYFRYDFSVAENGSYNFIFLFPFQVAQKISSTKSMNYNSTPYGTAVWLKNRVVDVDVGWKSKYIWGEFYVTNTFQSGTRGDYIFALPFIMGVGGPSDVIDELQRELKVAWHSPDVKVELEFTVPSRLQITQAYPQSFLGPDTLTITGNRTINMVRWNVSWPSQQFTVICRDNKETAYYQSILFLSGIFISIGAGVVVRSVYDAAREKCRLAEQNDWMLRQL